MKINNTQSYRADIQGLRAIAIILVILAHAKVPFFSGGFIGVDIFFVLSGYLITSLLVREFIRSGTIQLSVFFARRLKRLLPSLLLMIITVSFFASILLSDYEYFMQISSSLYASTWTSNFYFALEDFEYFNDFQTRDLFLHTWSLGVEEQFYLLWPLLLLSVFSIFTIKSRNYYKKVIVTIGLLFIASFVLSIIWSNSKPLWSFYFMPSRIWQFALGASVYFWFDLYIEQHSKKSSMKKIYSVTAGTIGLVLIISSAVFIDSNMTYSGFWAIIPSIGAALIIATGTQQNSSPVNDVFSKPILVWIGNRSYSWYLWHWPVLILGYYWGVEKQCDFNVNKHKKLIKVDVLAKLRHSRILLAGIHIY